MFITASTEGTGSWRNLITNLALELKISLEADKPEQKYASFFSKHFQCNKVSNKIKAFLEGSSIKTFMNLYKEWQSRDKFRAFKARYDKTYAVSSNHFTGFCKVHSLDFNIEESITNCKCPSSKGSAGNTKCRFGISYKNYTA